MQQKQMIMRIKDSSGMEHSVASSGVGNTGLGLGIAGTALGLMNAGGGGCGGGLFGGLFGGNNNNNNCCDAVSQKELAYATALAACQGREYALATAREESAAIFAESRRQDDRLAGVVKDVTGGLLQIGNGVAELNQITKCLQLQVDRNREESARDLREAKDYTDCRVNAEAQLRVCGDQNVLAYTNSELAKKISGSLVIDGDTVAYNRCKPILEQCGCLGTPSNPLNVELVVAAVQAAVTKAMAIK